MNIFLNHHINIIFMYVIALFHIYVYIEIPSSTAALAER